MRRDDRYYDEDGDVGILISYGFGVGWSTWNEEHAELLATHPALVKLCLEDGSREEAVQILKDLLPPSEFDELYFGGWDQCRVVWVKPGVVFEIVEYDGNESLRLVARDWLVA